VLRVLPLWFVALSLHAQTGENVLLVFNRNVPLSRQIADYYRPRRSVPVKNVCAIDTTGAILGLLVIYLVTQRLQANKTTTAAEQESTVEV